VKLEEKKGIPIGFILPDEWGKRFTESIDFIHISLQVFFWEPILIELIVFYRNHLPAIQLTGSLVSLSKLIFLFCNESEVDLGRRVGSVLSGRSFTEATEDEPIGLLELVLFNVPVNSPDFFGIGLGVDNLLLALVFVLFTFLVCIITSSLTDINVVILMVIVAGWANYWLFWIVQSD